MTPIILVIISVLSSVSLSNEHRINTVEDFISFSKNVKDGDNYFGTTVLLDSDIDFSGKTFEPIGTDEDDCFDGVFNGQGHLINNLAVNSSKNSVGLFGFSEGATIMNVVIGHSCSFASTYASSSELDDEAYLGSVVGRCYSTNESCVVENVVNMASVSFDGSGPGNIFIGGILGYLFLSSLSSFSENSTNLKNCANYGSVSCFGQNSEWSYLGGVAGSIEGSDDLQISVQNCLNYGAITHSGPGILAIGGIAGGSSYSIFENCVSSGAMSANQEDDIIGSIAGKILEDSEIDHCYWTSDVGNDNPHGDNESDVRVTDSSLVTLDQETLKQLNEYIPDTDDSWGKWVLLHLGGGKATNDSNKESVIGIVSALPVPVREGNAFLFWTKDPERIEKFDPAADDTTDLYVVWETYKIFFVLGNRTVLTKTFKYNCSIEPPQGVTKLGHTLVGWDITLDVMPARDVTITALWEPNEYNLIFDFDNGIDAKTEKKLKFGDVIEYPESGVKKGFKFIGWKPKPRTMPATDLIIKAKWVKNSGFVEVIFGSPDVTESDIVNYLANFTNADFTIDSIGYDTIAGTTEAIIKFDDSEEMSTLVERVRKAVMDELMMEKKPFVLEITPVYRDESYSHGFYPLVLFIFSLLF